MVKVDNEVVDRLIIKNNFIMGIGAGDIDQEIVNFYIKNNFDNGVWFRFNEHNQYLRFWLSGGILGISVFVALLFILWSKFLP